MSVSNMEVLKNNAHIALDGLAVDLSSSGLESILYATMSLDDITRDILAQLPRCGTLFLQLV